MPHPLHEEISKEEWSNGTNIDFITHSGKNTPCIYSLCSFSCLWMQGMKVTRNLMYVGLETVFLDKHMALLNTLSHRLELYTPANVTAPYYCRVRDIRRVTRPSEVVYALKVTWFYNAKDIAARATIFKITRSNNEEDVSGNLACFQSLHEVMGKDEYVEITDYFDYVTVDSCKSKLCHCRIHKWECSLICRNPL
jgi:hypothetical protein